MSEENLDPEIYHPFEKWYASLDKKTRSRADKMIALMKMKGVDNAEVWVRSEIEEDIPQMGRYLFLRHIWDKVSNWQEDFDRQLVLVQQQGERNPDGYYASASNAIKKMLAAGISTNDIKAVTQLGAYEMMFHLIQVLDDGEDPDADEGWPGWVLLEINSKGKATGRILDALHESVLEILPEAEQRKYV